MRKLLAAATLVLALVFSTESTAQKFSDLDKSPSDFATYPSSYKVSDKAVRISYGRPQLKGRALADLAPNGKVWRTGANEAPEITFYADATFGGKSIKAGTYSLLTIPGEKEWTIILNKNLNQWGAYSYDKSSDVARISGKVSSDSKSLEAFSIAFGEDGTMHLGWGTTRVAIPVERQMM
ncbi:MAG: DUF2911 domain-containing protein [Cellulophaga sp.]